MNPKKSVGVILFKTEFKTGDIIFIQNNHPIAWLIRLFTRSAWSHTASILVLDGYAFVVEATIFGVKMQPIETHSFWRKLHTIGRLKGRGDTENSITQFFLMRAVGKRYDIAYTLIYQPIYQISKRWLKRKNKGKLVQILEHILQIDGTSKRKYYACSELSADVIGLDTTLSPQGLYENREIEIIK